jgi:hypothetical protein
VSADAVDKEDHWITHRDRLVGENTQIRVSLADVELPDGAEFTLPRITPGSELVGDTGIEPVTSSV